MNLELVGLILGCFFNAALGAVVLFRNPKAIESQAFLGFAFFNVLWIISNYLTDHSSASSIDFFARAAFAMPLLSIIFLVLFSLAFTDGVKKVKKYLPLLMLAAIAGLAASFAGFVVEDAYRLTDTAKTSIAPGRLYTVYLLLIVLLFSASLAIFMKEYKRSSNKRLRAQLRVMQIGLSFSFLGIILTNAIIPVISGDWSTAKVGPLFTIIMVSSITYAIIRHRLFDIRLVVARSLAYISALTVLIVTLLVFAFAILGLTKYVFPGMSTGMLHALYFVSITFLIVTFHPLKVYFDRLTDRLFFRNSYNPQTVLDELGEIVANEESLTRLIMDAMNVINSALKPSFISVYLIDDKDQSKHEYFLEKKISISHNVLNSLIAYNSQILITDNLSGVKPHLYEQLKNMEASLVIRLRTSKKIIGFVLLGYKQNGNAYNSRDTGLLAVATDELSVAIQNALRFEEIQKFNETLQAKVDEATAQLKRSNEKLKSLDKAKDEFVSMASHQLRTPLTSIKGYVSMVLDGDAGELNPAQRKLLQESYDSSQRMVYLIGDFLNVSRLNTGKFVLELGDADLSKIISDEVEQLKATATARHITLHYDKPEAFPAIVMDETKIRQVLMNFIDNAIYYSRADSTIKIELSKNGKEIVCKIKDSGIGVPATERHHLFTKFYRASNARKARPDGTGIGLFMAKKVIVAHGGSIIFETEEGKGSTFGFSLPIKGAKHHSSQG